MEIKDCYGCGGCVAVCPEGALTLDGVVNRMVEKCIKCGICEHVCPAGLIKIK